MLVAVAVAVAAHRSRRCARRSVPHCALTGYSGTAGLPRQRPSPFCRRYCLRIRHQGWVRASFGGTVHPALRLQPCKNPPLTVPPWLVGRAQAPWCTGWCRSGGTWSEVLPRTSHNSPACWRACDCATSTTHTRGTGADLSQLFSLPWMPASACWHCFCSTRFR